MQTTQFQKSSEIFKFSKESHHSINLEKSSAQKNYGENSILTPEYNFIIHHNWNYVKTQGSPVFVKKIS